MQRDELQASVKAELSASQIRLVLARACVFVLKPSRLNVQQLLLSSKRKGGAT
jgi:hypothetical protein